MGMKAGQRANSRRIFSDFSATDRAKLSLCSSSFCASAASVAARISTAKMAALTAPCFPIAVQATGTPPGICTIDSSESTPARAVVAMGTPITGKVVSAAITPARCAAPPAPTTTTLRPRSLARRAYSVVRAGDRWAEVISTSNGTPNCLSVDADSLITGRSESLPMTIPTSGRGSAVISFLQSSSSIRDPRGIYAPGRAPRRANPRVAGRCRLNPAESLRTDVVTVVYSLEMDLLHRGVGPLDCGPQILSGRRDAQDPPRGGDESVIFKLGSGVEHLHAAHCFRRFVTGDCLSDLGLRRVAARGHYHTDRRIRTPVCIEMPEPSLADAEKEFHKVRAQPHEDRLSFRVPQADVIF